ncbi:MAG: cytochrome P450 [Pseudomonadota bacterium]
MEEHLIPPKPVSGKASPLRRLRDAMKPGSEGSKVGYKTLVVRHKLPRIPGLRQRYTYSIRDPAVARTVLVERAADFPKSRIMYAMLSPLVGNSVFVSNGETWRKQRVVMDRAFEAARLRDAFPKMLEASQSLVERLEEPAAQGALVPIESEATHAAADIIFRTIFSEPIDGESAEALFQAFTGFQRLAYVQDIISLTGLPLWSMPGRLRSWRRARKIRAALGKLLDRRLAAVAAGDAVPEDDILANLLKSKDPDSGAPLDRGYLLNEIATLFLAGHESSAAAMGWSLYLLARSPEAQERARAEVRAVLGEREPTFADMSKLTFLRDVFRETLRLYPPVANVARDTTKEEQLGKWSLGPGAPVFVRTWQLQRHPEIWPEADRFDPDRWQCPYAKKAQKQAYFPFSAGPRVCSGAAFAMLEAALVLALLLRRYRFLPPEGAAPPQPTVRLTLRSAKGIDLRVEALGD